MTVPVNARRPRGGPLASRAIVLLALLALLAAACSGSEPADDAADAGEDTGGAAEDAASGDAAAAPDDATDAEGGASEAAADDGASEGSEPAAPANDQPLSVSFGWFPVFHTATAFVADGAGFWDEQNLEVEMVRGESGAALSNMVALGQVDFSYAAIETVVQAQAEGRDLLQIMPLVNTFTLNTVVSNEAAERAGVTLDDPIEDRLAAFAEMTVGYTTPGSPTDRWSRFFMQLAGINPETEGTLVSVGSAPNLQAALQTGQIDAYMLTPPGATVPELEGYGQSFIRGTDNDVPQLEGFADTAVGTTASWLEDENNREAAVRLLVGLLQAAELIQEDPDAALEHLLAYFPDMDPEVARAGLDDMLPALDSPEMTQDSVEAQLDVLFDNNLVEAAERPSGDDGVLWRGDLFEEAQARFEALAD